jgi:hypothetical protein
MQRRLAAALSSALWPFGVYSLLSLLMFGLPIVAGPQHTILAADEIDSSQFMWFYGWWPHALLHGLNPFVTHHQFVPEGFNLQWSTSVPLPSLLLSPVTLALGPVVTWNAVQLAAPALNSWTAFLLCRHVTGRLGPSLLGGYVFGFSPYVLLHLTGGPNAGLVPLVPVFVLLVLKRLDGSLGDGRFVVAMAGALTAQYLIFNEVLATATLFGAIALALAFALFKERRQEVLRVAGLLVVAYTAAAVLLSPFLAYFIFGDRYSPGATHFAAALANFALPPSLTELTHVLGVSFRGSSAQTYIGLPLIALLAIFAWQGRGDRRVWLLVICLVVAALASLGAELTIRGGGLDERPEGTGIPLPWALFDDLPLLRHATPGRFALYVALPAAVIVSMWLVRGGRGRWALAALVVITFLPNVGSAAWKTKISDPAFFETGDYRAVLEANDHVLTVPAWGPNERWQANTGFDFRLAGGYLGNPFPSSYARYPTWNTLVTGRLSPDHARDLRRFVRDKGVTVVVVDKRYPGPWTELFGSLGVRPRDTGGVLLYRLRAPAG